MKPSERRIMNKKANLSFTGSGYVSLDELKDGEDTILRIPGKGTFLVYKDLGNFFHVRLYEGAPR